MPEEAQFAEMTNHLAREYFLFVPPGRVRLDLALGELAQRVANRALLVAKIEVHRRDPAVIRRARLSFTGLHALAQPLDDVLGRSAGGKDFLDAGLAEFFGVVLGDDSSAEDRDIAGAALL